MKNLNVLCCGQEENSQSDVAEKRPAWFTPLYAVALVSLVSLPAYSQEKVVSNNDSDGDRIVDTVDVDDDNDGVLDVMEIFTSGTDRDTDNDGTPDRLDLDSDNDGILDWKESGAVITIDFSPLRIVSGRILGEVGNNGYIDALETSVDSGQSRYVLVNSDLPADAIPDMLDLDSDNDGLPDMIEAGIDSSYDADNDGRIDSDSASGSVGNDGIPDRLQTSNDQTCCDINGDGIEDSVPRNSDLSDLPDFQDLDSDNDGVFDLVEAGGRDFDNDGRVDNFFDSPVLDGMDDTILMIPLAQSDNNGNGLEDYIDPFVQAGITSTAEEQNTDQTTSQNADSVQAVQPNTTAEPVNSDDAINAAIEAAVDAAIDAALDANVAGAPAQTVIEIDVVEREPADRPGDNILADTPAEDDPALGVVQTGLNASGCSVQSTGVDLLLLLMAVLSIAVLGWRYTLRRAHRQ